MGSLERLPATGDGGFVYRAPGRANLIGEHTDYNEGLALPVALEQSMYVAILRRHEVVSVRSLDLLGEVVVDPRTGRGPQRGWGRYVTAVVRALRDSGIEPLGAEAVIASDVPGGAGLASSAALEVALVGILAPEPLDPLQTARICRRAENEYVGVQSGIMDQLAATASHAGHGLLIDCRDETISFVPLPASLAVLVIDSGVRRGLDDTPYNERRRECAEAARALGVRTLRDAGREDLERVRRRLGERVYRRARHVVTENERVQRSVDALREGRAGELGDLFASGHESLARDYEVSTPELDVLVAIARATPDIIAARLTGAGFGGCTVNLVHSDAAFDAARSIERAYRIRTGLSTRSWISRPAAGAGPV